MSDIYKQRQYEVEKELEHIEMLNNIIPAFEDYTKEVDNFIDRIIKSDIEQLNEKGKEIKRLHSIIKEVRECINHYAIEDEDFSKIYNQEEQELLEILDKVEENNGKD